MTATARWFLAFVVLAAPVLRAQDPPSDVKATAKEAPPPIPAAPKPAITHHRITLGGKTIAYTAIASTIDIRDAKGEVTARMFSVAYTAEGSDAKKRPVTFAFNGGPGSSSMWLHMGSFGPVRVVTSDAEPTPPPPYRIVENDESLLDRTDLVFIDAVGTGFSRIVGKGEPKSFYGTDGDVAAFAQFIQRWLGGNGRWNSPKFILGESWGSTRGAALLAYMERRGVAFNGAILVSSYLNAWDDFNGPAFSNDRAYELYLPTMAATAWYHKKLDPMPADLTAFLAEVRKFALGEYAQALDRGKDLDAAARDAIAAKLHRYTSLPESVIVDGNLRIDLGRFEKELLRGERRTIGRIDSRFEGIDHDAAGESPEYDASTSAFGSAFTGAFNAYVRETLDYSTDDLYKATNYEEVDSDWDYRHRFDGVQWPMLDVAEDLRTVMSINPHLRIFSANGYFDFATSFFETEYTLSHMGLDPSLEKNIVYGYYASGHLIYMHDGSREKMRDDLAKFYDDTLARSEAAR